MSALVLAVVCLLAGLRIGFESVDAYVRDTQRLNRMLDEQNRELKSANASLLRELAAQTGGSPHDTSTSESK